MIPAISASSTIMPIPWRIVAVTVPRSHGSTASATLSRAAASNWSIDGIQFDQRVQSSRLSWPGCTT